MHKKKAAYSRHNIGNELNVKTKDNDEKETRLDAAGCDILKKLPYNMLKQRKRTDTKAGSNKKYFCVLQCIFKEWQCRHYKGMWWWPCVACLKCTQTKVVFDFLDVTVWHSVRISNYPSLGPSRISRQIFWPLKLQYELSFVGAAVWTILLFFFF